VKPEARGSPDHRVLGAQQILAGWANDIEQLRSKLNAKAGRYGHPQVPLVTAVLCMSSGMQRLDIEQALFGREAFMVDSATREPRLVRQRNGFWVAGDGPQNRRVSAVLTAVCLHPWNAPKVAPHVWLNPWAHHALTEEWPFPHATATNRGEITYREADTDMYSLLGLPPNWPGGEPFPRNRG
jgi:hypothetical protein